MCPCQCVIINYVDVCVTGCQFQMLVKKHFIINAFINPLEIEMTWGDLIYSADLVIYFHVMGKYLKLIFKRV